MNKYKEVDKKTTDATTIETVDAIILDGRMGYFDSEWWKYYPYNLALKIVEDRDMLDRILPHMLIRVLSETATERELKIIRLYFRNGLTYAEVGKIENVTTERIRQIIQKVIRKMRHPLRLKRYLSSSYDTINSLENELAAYKEQFGVISTEELNPRILDDLNLSVRAHNCLLRAGKTHAKNFDCMKVRDLMRIRNLGRKSFIETVLKLVDYGFNLRKIGTNEYLYVDTTALYEPEDFYDYYLSWTKVKEQKKIENTVERIGGTNYALLKA